MHTEAPFQAVTTVLSTTGSTRGTGYEMSNKIVTIGSRTHVTWLDAIADIKVMKYSHQRNKWDEPVLVGKGVDNHSGPCMCSDSQGYLHIVFGPHHGPFQYSVSARPNDSSEWIPQPEFGVTGTYPSLVCDADDTLHITYRGMDTPTKLIYQRKPKGDQWSEPRILVDAGVPDKYTQFGNALYPHSDGTLHLAFHVYDMHPAGGRSAGYLMSDDAGQTWKLADGSIIQAPFTPDMPGWVEQSPDFDMRAANVACDPDGHPYFCVTHYETKPMRTTLWTWDGEWKAIPLNSWTDAISPGANVTLSTVCFDTAGALYIAAQVSSSGGWGSPHTETVLLYSTDRGNTFSLLPLSSDSGEAGNWMPSIERNAGHNPVEIPGIVYTHGITGTTCADLIYTEIRHVKLQPK